MKSTLQFIAVLFAWTSVTAAEPLKPTALQIRLVADGPGQGIEEMTAKRAVKGKETAIAQVIHVHKEVLLDRDSVETAVTKPDPITRNSDVEITFTSEGKALFAKVTREHTGKMLAIISNGKILSTPRVITEITGGKAAISGGLTEKEANELAMQLGGKSPPSEPRKKK